MRDGRACSRRSFQPRQPGAVGADARGVTEPAPPADPARARSCLQGTHAGPRLPPEVAGEIAFYLARRPTSLSPVEPWRLRWTPKASSCAARPGRPHAGSAAHRARAAGTLVWCLTDGFAWYRGSHAQRRCPASGSRQFGSPPAAQHLCQDKLRASPWPRAAGLRTPPTLLVEDSDTAGPLEVLPERPCSSSRTRWAPSSASTTAAGLDLDEALAPDPPHLAALWRPRADPALPAGSDVRVSFMDLGREPPPLGIHASDLGPDRLPDAGRFLRMTRLDACGRPTASTSRGKPRRHRRPATHSRPPPATSPASPTCATTGRWISASARTAALVPRARGLPGGHDLRFPDLPARGAWGGAARGDRASGQVSFCKTDGA